MNGHAKRAIKMLEALDFRVDTERSSKGEKYYWHPNDPSQRVKVFAGFSEAASKAVQAKANKVADTGWSGPAMPKSIKDTARIKRSDAKRKREASMAATAARADKAEAKHAERDRIISALADMREIESLMRPGTGR